MSGRSWFEQSQLQKIVGSALAIEKGEPARSGPLTERERQVLSFVFQGLANKEIASQLQVSESSVKGTLQQLFQKAGARTRSQLVLIALERYKDQL
jgi:two-component system nitrate/nitrite response regulator NarL